jgi:hypothetical protein
MNILSSVDLFGLKPDWTSLSLDSTISDSLLFSIIVSILYAILSSVVGLYLEHMVHSPFLCIGQIIP